MKFPLIYIIHSDSHLDAQLVTISKYTAILQKISPTAHPMFQHTEAATPLTAKLPRHHIGAAWRFVALGASIIEALIWAINYRGLRKNLPEIDPMKIGAMFTEK